jgi:hypothetical protein
MVKWNIHYYHSCFAYTVYGWIFHFSDFDKNNHFITEPDYQINNFIQK